MHQADDGMNIFFFLYFLLFFIGTRTPGEAVYMQQQQQQKIYTSFGWFGCWCFLPSFGAIGATMWSLLHTPPYSHINGFMPCCFFVIFFFLYAVCALTWSYEITWHRTRPSTQYTRDLKCFSNYKEYI